MKRRIIIMSFLAVVLVSMGGEKSPSPQNVKQAVLRAIDLSKGHHIFNRHLRTKKGEVSSNHFRDVEILGTKNEDGSFQVLFSLPISSVMVSAGRKATTNLLQVTFSGTDSVVQTYSVPEEQIDENAEQAFCSAVSTVLEENLSERDRIEVAVGIMKRENGLFVMVTRIPYIPGGHTGYIVTQNNEIERILPGK